MINATASDAFPLHAAQLASWCDAAMPSTVAALLGGARSLAVIVPHPDDETLGCGGLIAAASDAGMDVEVIALTDGAASHPQSRSWPPRRLGDQRRREFARAVAVLTRSRGRMRVLDLPDGSLDACLGRIALHTDAELIVTCWRDDPHPDHRAAFVVASGIAASTARPLLAFPLWVLTTEIGLAGDAPLWQIDVGPWLDRKRRALAAHRSQLGLLVRDDPTGFVLDAGLQKLFVRRDELYLAISATATASLSRVP